MQDRTVRWLQRSMNADNSAVSGGAPAGHSNRERSSSVMSGSTSFSAGGSRLSLRLQASLNPFGNVSAGSGGGGRNASGEPLSPGTASTKEDGILLCHILKNGRTNGVP